MNTRQDLYQLERCERSLEEIDREVARLALLCRTRVLDPGVIERIIHNDKSVCSTDNPIAFRKLRGLLMLHFMVREASAGNLGRAETAAIEGFVIERLMKVFPGLEGRWPPV